MNVFAIHKGIGRLNACRKPIVVAAIVVMVMPIFVGCEEAYTPALKEPINVSAPTSSEIASLSEEIKQLVKGLEYSNKVAEDFVRMVISWKDAKGQPILVVWQKKLSKTKEDYGQGKMSKVQLAKVEGSIARELGQRIKKQISPDPDIKLFDLADIIKRKQAQCLGYSQIFYVLGDSVGLSVKATNVIEMVTPGPIPEGYGHAACIVSLTDGRTIIVDLVIDLVSRPFIVDKEFAKVGNYWELKNKENPLRVHRRIQILDKNGLIACIYYNQGNAYRKLGQLTKAISDYTKAIKLNPKLAEVYMGRGFAYHKLGQYNQSISDNSKAIELNPKLGVAYNNRGLTYLVLGQLNKAIHDFDKAIELNPNHVKAYGSRGLAYASIGKLEKAKKDLLKAVELNPDVKANVKQISDQFNLNLKLD